MKNISEIKNHNIASAIKIIKNEKLANFKKTRERIDVAIKFNINSKNKSKYKNHDGFIIFPYFSGKIPVISVLSDDKNIENMPTTYFNIINSKDLKQQAKKNKFNFDILMATNHNNLIPKKILKILNKYKLLQNLTDNTIGTGISNLIENIKNIIMKKVNYKICKSGIIHAPISRVDFTNFVIIKNITAFVNMIRDKKPSNLKGIYIKKISISKTMGQNYNLDSESISTFHRK